MQHFDTIKKYNNFLGYDKPKKDLIDVVKYANYDKLQLTCSGITSDFYTIAFKRNMTDLEWFGNTEFDTKSAFLYFIKPEQVHKWDVKKPWEGSHILVSPILLSAYNIDFSFFKYEINEALFLTEEEQVQIESLYVQIYKEYDKDNYDLALLVAYCNLIFTYISTCYKRQFETRQPLYNKIVVAFKKLLHNFYSKNLNELPSVHYFAEKLHLSTNYFGDLIKHNTGETASEIIQQKVIAEAKIQLKSTDKTIAEIGYNLGFEYPTYFARLFKKHIGKTPSQYRK